MTITTIYRVFFPWTEFQAMQEFEKMHTQYKKVGEDTLGTAYEYRTNYIVNLNEGEQNDKATME